ncbi:hypothetical protein [Christiangramia aestuarii]|uniref:Uncharacterized protein n=1 Tax=Christiangramia aestuarii TaxID=1028746 RepID=A0A7K1LQ18_9FLAO|nr:hypothetical protein [Christiangramia aestuarii]MUP42876.1 hypothetical protein [Christiangramia aestuarii]
MKLVNISKPEDTYIVKVLHTYKLFGLSLSSYVKAYACSNDENWYEVKNGKKVSRNKSVKLNKWLKDHQKFIEKAEP